MIDGNSALISCHSSIHVLVIAVYASTNEWNTYVFYGAPED